MVFLAPRYACMPMKQRFWLFRRSTTFYCQDSVTGEQKSLGTKDRKEAARLIEIRRQGVESPTMSRYLFKAYLATQDPRLATRTWNAVMDQMSTQGKEPTKARCQRAMASKEFDSIRQKKLVDTTAEDLLEILNRASCSTNHFLRRLHNLALGLGWIPSPVLAPKLWPKPVFGEKRAITAEEHQRILGAEMNPERKLFYQVLWEIGAAQSAAAELTAENVDLKNRVLSFRRKKTDAWCRLAIGPTLNGILEQLPKAGPLFPVIAKTSANDRAAEFWRRCKLLKISGVSLHSYRYSLAERAKAAGISERFSMEMLGHNSRPMIVLRLTWSGFCAFFN